MPVAERPCWPTAFRNCSIAPRARTTPTELITRDGPYRSKTHSRRTTCSFKSIDAPIGGMPSLTALPSIATTVAAGVGAFSIAAYLDARSKSRKPELRYNATKFNEEILRRCSSLSSVYKACTFLTNCHVETIFAALCRRDPNLEYYRRCLTMKDGGTVTLDYELLPAEKELPPDAPVMLLLPGLTGGSHDVYVQDMVQQARQRGYRAVVFNGRGTSDSPVTTPQFYSASYTEDTRAVTRHLQQQFPDSQLLAVGWSLGGNILLRYLGEEGERAPFAAAASLCNPFDLPLANANFEKGFNRVYDKRLAQSLSTIFRQHRAVFLARNNAMDLELAGKCTTIRQFDEAVTSVAFGWPSVDAYYAGSSSALSVPHITIPLLCIQAADDPIAPAAGIPYKALEANENCILSVTPVGGHLGWVDPSDPRGPPSVHPSVIDFFSAVLETQQDESPQEAVAQSAERPLETGAAAAAQPQHDPAILN